MEAITGFGELKNRNRVLLLKISLYGLKQVAHVWNNLIVSELKNIGFGNLWANTKLVRRYPILE